MTTGPTILIVDDAARNLRLLEAILNPRGYATTTASSGEEALERAMSGRVDLVLLDIVMPGMDGYEVCRRLRADDATRFLPVVMVTASGDREKIKALEAEADDFIAKPFDQAELLARVRSLVRIKRYHDTITAQAAELQQLNHRLEQRVHQQVDQLERVGRLRRFLSPQVADLVVSSGDESFLESHRREITVVFCDLVGFADLAASVEPEELIRVLGEYHAAIGELVHRFEGTLERFTGDGRIMVFFNDPLPCADSPERAVGIAIGMRNCVWGLAEEWSRLGYELQAGIGVAQGHATLGRVGFRERWDYAAVGTPTSLAERLCEVTEPGQILISQRIHAATEATIVAHPVGELALRGLPRPARAYDLVGLDRA